MDVHAARTASCTAGRSGPPTLDLATLGPLTDVLSGEHREPDALRERILGRAAKVARAGLGRGDTLLVISSHAFEVLPTVLAGWQAGLRVACLDPGLSPRERTAAVGRLAPALVITDQARCTVPGVPALDFAALDCATPAAAVPAPACATHDAALVLFTSGSSGTPKGVALSHAALDARIRSNLRRIGRATLARTLCPLPVHFGHGLIGNCLTPWLSGGHLHVARDEAAPAGRELGRRLDAHRITFLSSVPAQWRIAMALGDPPRAGSLRRVHVGSAPLSAALWRDIARFSGCREVVNCYGMTELANWVAGASSAEHEPADGLVGRPWEGEVQVLDATGARRASGEGELVVRSRACMSGYLHDAGATARVLDGGWLRTGDRGRIDGAGRIRLAGRDDQVINRAGSKVHPEELEMLLETHPQVAECCAFGVPDPLAGEAVAIAVRPRDGASCDVEALAHWCRARIRAEAVPTRWHLVAALARSARGKLDRARVRAGCLAAPGAQAALAGAAPPP